VWGTQAEVIASIVEELREVERLRAELMTEGLGDDGASLHRLDSRRDWLDHQIGAQTDGDLDMP